MALRFMLLLVAAVPITGCHSAFIEATVSNHTAATLSEVEVDYPSASFGTTTLAPNTDFHYRFKILGSGATTLLWTDAAHHDHKAPGPSFKENDEGTLTIVITEATPTWSYEPTSDKR